jgi:hypothetical protein
LLKGAKCEIFDHETVYRLKRFFGKQSSDPDPHFLSLPDPDPLVRGMDPDPDPSSIKHKSKKNFDSYCAAEAIFCCPTENSHHLEG